MLITPAVHHSALTTCGLREGLEHVGQERREERGSMFVDTGHHLSMLGKGFPGDSYWGKSTHPL